MSLISYMPPSLNEMIQTYSKCISKSLPIEEPRMNFKINRKPYSGILKRHGSNVSTKYLIMTNLLGLLLVKTCSEGIEHSTTLD